MQTSQYFFLLSQHRSKIFHLLDVCYSPHPLYFSWGYNTFPDFLLFFFFFPPDFSIFHHTASRKHLPVVSPICRGLNGTLIFSPFLLPGHCYFGHLWPSALSCYQLSGFHKYLRHCLLPCVYILPYSIVITYLFKDTGGGQPCVPPAYTLLMALDVYAKLSQHHQGIGFCHFHFVSEAIDVSQFKTFVQGFFQVAHPICYPVT